MPASKAHGRFKIACMDHATARCSICLANHPRIQCRVCCILGDFVAAWVRFEALVSPLWARAASSPPPIPLPSADSVDILELFRASSLQGSNVAHLATRYPRSDLGRRSFKSSGEGSTASAASKAVCLFVVSSCRFTGSNPEASQPREQEAILGRDQFIDHFAVLTRINKLSIRTLQPPNEINSCKLSSQCQTRPPKPSRFGASNNMTQCDEDPYRLSTNLAQKIALQPARVREGRTCTLLPCCRPKETEAPARK